MRKILTALGLAAAAVMMIAAFPFIQVDDGIILVTDGKIQFAAAADDADYIAYTNRVITNGGVIVSTTDIKAAIKNAKDNSYWTSVKCWYSGQFGIKTNGAGLVATWYDLSTNNNDAVQTTVAEQPTWVTNT